MKHTRTSFMLFSTATHCTECEELRVDGNTSQKASARTKASVCALKMTTASAKGYSCDTVQYKARRMCRQQDTQVEFLGEGGGS